MVFCSIRRTLTINPSKWKIFPFRCNKYFSVSNENFAQKEEKQCGFSNNVFPRYPKTTLTGDPLYIVNCQTVITIDIVIEFFLKRNLREHFPMNTFLRCDYFRLQKWRYKDRKIIKSYSSGPNKHVHKCTNGPQVL